MAQINRDWIELKPQTKLILAVETIILDRYTEFNEFLINLHTQKNLQPSEFLNHVKNVQFCSCVLSFPAIEKLNITVHMSDAPKSPVP